MRILFMGTPDYARVILEGLHRLGSVDLRVVSKPDAISGRGRRRISSPVSDYALMQGIVLDRPDNLSEGREDWERFAPDLVITAAFGRILPAWLLSLPRVGALNLHASLLPRWRGPNPIAWAIFAGDPVTGVTLMQMDEGVDTGGVVAKTTVTLSGHETVGELTDRLAVSARDLLLESLPRLICDPWEVMPQPVEGVTYAPKFTPDMARLNWGGAALVEARRVRSMTPAPGAYTMWNQMRIKVGAATAMPGMMPQGEAILDGDQWRVGCKDGVLLVEQIQPAGKRWMAPGAFMRGQPSVKRVILE